MGHFFSKVSLFIDKKEAAAHLILDQDFATAPFCLSNFNHQFPYRIKPDCDFYLRNNNKICSGHKYSS